MRVEPGKQHRYGLAGDKEVAGADEITAGEYGGVEPVPGHRDAGPGLPDGSDGFAAETRGGVHRYGDDDGLGPGQEIRL